MMIMLENDFPIALNLNERITIDWRQRITIVGNCSRKSQKATVRNHLERKNKLNFVIIFSKYYSSSKTMTKFSKINYLITQKCLRQLPIKWIFRPEIGGKRNVAIGFRYHCQSICFIQTPIKCWQNKWWAIIWNL